MMSIYVGLNELYYDDMDTLVFLCSHVVDPKVSLDAPESELSSKVQMLPRTAQLIDFVFHILGSLSTEEVTALLDHTCLYSSCLSECSVWNEALQQTCSSYPNDCISNADAGTFAQAPRQDDYGFTVQPVDVAGNSLTTILQPCIEDFSIAESVTTGWPGPLEVDNHQVNWNTASTSSHTLPQDICYSTEKDTSLGGPCAIKIQQSEISCGPSTPALPIPRTGCTLENNPSQSKLGKQQSPECEIKYRPSQSVDTISIPVHKRRHSSSTSTVKKQVPPVEELGTAGDTPNTLEEDPILLVNKESYTFCLAARMPHLDQSQLNRIRNAGNNRLILDNFSEFLIVNSASWLLNEAQGQHGLGIPLPNFTSYQSACVAYFKALQAQPRANRKSTLGRLYRYVMQIWFHLFFNEFVQELTKKEKAGKLHIPRQGRQISTIARDFILEEVYGDIPQEQKQQKRQRISDEIHWGGRWWMIASCIGLGSVLFASEELAIRMYFCLWHDSSENSYWMHRGDTTFKEPELNGLINYLVNVYPRLVSLFEEFGPITRTLMLGKGFYTLVEKIKVSAFHDRLTKAVQRVQCPPDAWQAINPGLVSASASDDFMRFRQEYFQTEAAGSSDDEMSNDTG